MRYFHYRLIAIAVAIALGLTRASLSHRTGQSEETDAAWSQESQQSEPGPAAAGRAALAAKDYDQAVTCFDTALQLTPKESALYIERATAFEGKKQYDRAIKDLTEVIRLAPGGIEGY